MKKQWLMIWGTLVLTIVAVAGPVWAVTPLISIGTLRPELVGQEVQVRGRVIDVAKPYPNLYEFVIKDDTGKITMRLPRPIYESVPKRSWLNENAEVLVRVRVGSDAAGLYLQPSSGKDITVLSPGSGTQAALRPTNRLGGIGSIVAIEGRIIDLPPTPFGRLLIVADSFGSTTVRILGSVLKFVPHAEQLVVGAPVHVVGRVEYRRGPQVVPMLGEDVMVK